MSHLPDSNSNPLEISGAQFQQWLKLIGRCLGHHLDTLAEQPVVDTDDFEKVIRGFDLKIGESGMEFESVLSYLMEQAIPCSFNTASPGYLAYIPGGGLPQSALADLIAGTTNRYVGVWAAAPCLAKIEKKVIDWLCDLFELGDGSGGFLTSGGSLANWSALVTARNQRLGEEFWDGVAYVSDQAHHCLGKAARLSGIKSSHLAVVSTDAHQRMDVGNLESQIQEDLSSGKKPFFVAANAGTTNTGAVDSLNEIAEVCRRYGLWFHVDAAYGGFFMMTQRGRELFEGIQHADSVVVDPHKGLFLPYGTGALLVKQEQDLKETHRMDADYLPEYQDDSERTDFHEISPELSRDFRGLRVWLPLKVYGSEVFRDNLNEKLDLTDWIYSELRNRDFGNTKIEFLDEPRLSILAFRVIFPVDDSKQDGLNKELLIRINRRQRVYLTSTLIEGRFIIRICVLSFRTHRENLAHCLEDIFEEIEILDAEIQKNGGM